MDSESQPRAWESKLAPNALEAIAFARDNLPKLLELYCLQTFSRDQIEDAGIRDLDWTSYYRDMAASRELQLFLDPEETKKFAEELNEAFGDDRQAVFFCTLACLHTLLFNLNGLAHPEILLKRIREGDDKALFNFVKVDKTIVSHKYARRRIRMAQITGDHGFLQRLGKAIAYNHRKARFIAATTSWG